uniref:Uncharacterized protein n=1 Tax=Chromera velia CCMP2878 TaxID=1169474 RepID=A0A0G4HVQ4_9ALVE|eukprot:Cvel_8882.t1-p1 / transcript=Cvel_8882.t1 / gene=Cvel_8882 / organism=Chromera_velia_CCMP2878 / gene_product=hypothetical protein / transcript_product=hypothetical protein / location=Cvel_scaffold499:79711-79908(+) / protein_length=66 / sequence_SO=supercontig / SO=protein_coding / is_pseudo=false
MADLLRDRVGHTAAAALSLSGADKIFNRDQEGQSGSWEKGEKGGQWGRGEREGKGGKEGEGGVASG